MENSEFLNEVVKQRREMRFLHELRGEDWKNHLGKEPKVPQLQEGL